MAFTMRTTKPGKGNKYYIRKADGGYSRAIKGNPTDKDCNVLSNCVGYAYGRFNEIGGYGYCKYLAPVNAENFMKYKGSCKTGMTPKVGAVMVWQKGKTLKGSDGAGHVAIVEKVISDTQVYTSESGWKASKPFWNQIRKKGSNGRWGASSSYKFLGFIYNPAVKDEEAAPAAWPKTHKVVKGDTLSAIAKKYYGNSGKAYYTFIAEANNIKNINLISVGQVLTIPKYKAAAAATTITLEVGDKVKLKKGAVYYNDKRIPTWVFNSTLYVREIAGDRVVISTLRKGAVTGAVHKKYLSK